MNEERSQITVNRSQLDEEPCCLFAVIRDLRSVICELKKESCYDDRFE
jgi:hypothetical protein